jgi:hypothetical protein
MTFNPCTPRPVQSGKNIVLVFDTPFFETNGNRYKLIGGEITKDDVIQSVMNIDTKVIKEIPHKQLQKWFL